MVEAQRARTGFSFEEIFIDGDDRLELEYGLRVPVIEVDGEERFEYRVDPGALSALVSAS